jgi:hypothetical protein
VIGTRLYLTPKDIAWSEEPLVIDHLADHEVLVLVDIRSTLEEIVSDLRVQIGTYLTKQKKHTANFLEYLLVWDLRQRIRNGKRLSAEKIAPMLWPEEWENEGGRDTTGWKSSVSERVYYYEKKAQQLIDKRFPPRKRHRKSRK